MKKYVVLLLLIGVIAVMFGCKDTKYVLREDEEFVDTTVVYFDTAGFYYYYDNRLYFRFELFVYSNNDNVRFWYDSTFVYDHSGNLIMHDYTSTSQGYYGSFDRQIYTTDYPVIPTDDSLRYRVDFRIVEFKGYADTGMVYDTRRDTSYTGYAKYMD